MYNMIPRISGKARVHIGFLFRFEMENGTKGLQVSLWPRGSREWQPCSPARCAHIFHILLRRSTCTANAKILQLYFRKHSTCLIIASTGLYNHWTQRENCSGRCVRNMGLWTSDGLLPPNLHTIWTALLHKQKISHTYTKLSRNRIHRRGSELRYFNIISTMH